MAPGRHGFRQQRRVKGGEGMGGLVRGGGGCRESSISTGGYDNSALPRVV